MNGFVPSTLGFTVGEHENDVITGGSGNDLIQGNGGSDVLNGGAGNDIIYHFVERVRTFPDSGTSLGFTGTDTITCGSGQDEVFMNTSTDGDTAADDCEVVHAG